MDFFRMIATAAFITDGTACLILLVHYHLVRHNLTARRALLFFTGILTVVTTLFCMTHFGYLLPRGAWLALLSVALAFRSVTMFMFVLHMVALIDRDK